MKFVIITLLLQHISKDSLFNIYLYMYEMYYLVLCLWSGIGIVCALSPNA